MSPIPTPADAAAPVPASLPPLVTRFWIATTVLTGLSILYTAVMAARFNLHFPYGIGMLYDDSLWGDLLVFRPGFLHFRTPAFWTSFTYPFTYPAPLAIVLGVLFRFAHPVRVYLAIELAATAAAAWWFARQLLARNVSPLKSWAFSLTMLAMSWPLLFLFDTANAEGFVVILLALGVYAVLRRRWAVGAAFIALAGSMKLFPLILLALLLSERRYKEFAAALVLAAVVTVASLAVLGPSVLEAQRHLNVGFALIKQTYLFTMKPDAPALDHSLWVAVRYATVYSDRLLHPASPARTASLMETSLRLYLFASAAAGVALYFLRIRKLPVLNQVLALTVCAVLLPPLSLEYTLVHLLLPCALLCLYAIDTSRTTIAGLAPCFACFVILFNIETFLSNHVTYAAEFRTLALLTLLVLVLKHPFHWAELTPPRGAQPHAL